MSRTSTKPATKSNVVSIASPKTAKPQTISLELAVRLAPGHQLVENLLRTFGLEPVDFDGIRDAIGAQIRASGETLGEALNERALQIHLQRIVGAHVASAYGAAQFYGAKLSAAKDLSTRLGNDDRDEDRGGPSGFEKNPNCKGDCLDGGTIITAADLQAGLKMYNVTLGEGDAVFLNTGWEDLFLQFPAMNAVYNGSEPGINKAAAEWLTSQKVVLVGADTWAVEVIPGESAAVAFPVHVHLLADNGVHIVENVRTDLIAAAAQKDGRATFFLNMTVPKAVGFTGTFIAIEAIR